MSNIPSVAVVSCDEDFPVEGLVKLILKVDTLPPSTDIAEGIKAYPWSISTKYYTADVHLCCLDKKTLGNEEFADSVQGVAIIFNSKKSDGLESADQWMSFVKEWNPEINLLVCKDFQENQGVTKLQAQEWCISHEGFELIELESEINTEEDEEEDFPETVGLPRIIQALQAHLWPNLVMKATPKPGGELMQQLKQDGGGEGGEGSEIIQTLAADMSRNETIDSLLSDWLENEDDPSEMTEESFESLLSRLQKMKTTASELPHEERKVYAEKVAMAFWNAMGGSEEEGEGVEEKGDEEGQVKEVS